MPESVKVPVAASEKSAAPALKTCHALPSQNFAAGGVLFVSYQRSPLFGEPGAVVANVLVGFDPKVSFKSAAASTSPGAKSFLIAMSFLS
jgi:hypothetical protein